jgi:hypothetical protein
MLCKSITLRWFKQNRDVRIVDSGLKYVIEKQGIGESPYRGCRVAILYEGRLPNGKIFDRIRNRNHPFVFILGSNKIIKGFNKALMLMKAGSRALFLVPSRFGYGRKGKLPNIPRNTDLIFDIDLISFDPPLGPETVLTKNPIMAWREIETILCCSIGSQIVFFANESAEIIKKVICSNKIKVSELSRMLNVDAMVLIKFFDKVIDSNVVIISRNH